MAKSNARVVAVVAVLLMVMLMAPHAESITCDSVTKNLSACRQSLKGGGASVSGGCCNGVKAVDNSSKSTADRRTACECIKKLAKSYKVKAQTVQTVADKCNVKLGFTISNNVDCSKVH